jgi:Domain of unknown function (DUF5591)
MELQFESVRSDWYSANTLMPRLFIKAIRGDQPLKLVGFPAQWIPVCVHYGVPYSAPQAPLNYVPLFSDLSVEELGRLAAAARLHRASRLFLEASVALDPVIADLVYIVDHKLSTLRHAYQRGNDANMLNTWHSFCRPEVIQLQERMAREVVTSDSVLLLPCSRHRPYGESRTHARLSRRLTEAGHNAADIPRVVVTALGVVPETYWKHPLVMTYDAGAVDLWRVFQLLQAFFTTNRFSIVIDCLSFKPYSDMLEILQRLGVVRNRMRPLKVRWRGFYVDLA